MLPTPYVNQATVNQHMNGQPTQPHGIPAGAGNPQQQQPPLVGTPLCPTNTQPAPLPFFQNSPADTRTKSKNGQGVKKSKSLPADKLDITCWRCKQPGHLKCDCLMPPFCVKCRQEATFHITAHSRTTGTPRQVLKYRIQWTISSPTLGTNASTVGVNTTPQHVQRRLGYRQPQTAQS